MLLPSNFELIRHDWPGKPNEIPTDYSYTTRSRYEGRHRLDGSRQEGAQELNVDPLKLTRNQLEHLVSVRRSWPDISRQENGNRGGEIDALYDIFARQPVVIRTLQYVEQ